MFLSQSQPLASYRQFTSADIDDIRRGASKAGCTHQLITVSRPGLLSAWLNAAPLGRIGLGAMSYGADVLVDMGRPESFYQVMVPYAGTSEMEIGRNLIVANRLVGVTLNPTDSVRIAWKGDCSMVMMRIDRHALQEQLSLLMDRPIREPLRFSSIMRIEGHTHLWWRHVGLLIDELEKAGRGTHLPLSLAQLEAFLLTRLLETHDHNYSDKLGPDRGRGVAPRHVRRAMQFIEDHAHEPISMAQIVAVSGVSSRALFEGFRRFQEISPMRYLRVIRMRHIHRELKAGIPGTTVGGIAMRWGLFELGRFANEYRRSYGELPSETLRRCQID